MNNISVDDDILFAKMEKDFEEQQAKKELRIKHQLKMNESINLDENYDISWDTYNDICRKLISFYWSQKSIPNPSEEAQKTLVRMIKNHITYIMTGDTKWDKKYLEELDKEIVRRDKQWIK